MAGPALDPIIAGLLPAIETSFVGENSSFGGVRRPPFLFEGGGIIIRYGADAAVCTGRCELK